MKSDKLVAACLVFMIIHLHLKKSVGNQYEWNRRSHHLDFNNSMFIPLQYVVLPSVEKCNYYTIYSNHKWKYSSLNKSMYY